jgi:hypothetical protein
VRTAGVFLEQSERGRDREAFAASFARFFNVGYWGEMGRPVDGVTVCILVFVVVIVGLVGVVVVNEVLGIRFECKGV